jgi:Tfp pilus assembly protein PilN
VHKRGTHKNNLYYLMPGMGRGARKRFWRNMVFSVLVGLFISGLMVVLFSFLNNR